MNRFFVPRISWTSIVHRFLGVAFTQRAANCWAVAFVRNLQLLRKMMRWFRTEPNIGAARVLSIQELMNSTPRRFYDHHGFLHPLIDHEAGILNIFVLANHFGWSGTVFEEQCPITQVFLHESRMTQVPWEMRIIPTICRVHSIHVYIWKYGYEAGVSRFRQNLEKELMMGALTVRFSVFPSYTTTQGNLYNPDDSELMFDPLSGHYVLATALGSLHGVTALECQDCQGPTWGSSGYVYLALDVVDFFVVIR